MTDARCFCRRRLRWANNGCSYCPIHTPHLADNPNPIPVEVERRAKASDRPVWIVLANMLDADECAAVWETLDDLPSERRVELGRLGGVPAGEPPELDVFRGIDRARRRDSDTTSRGGDSP